MLGGAVQVALERSEGDLEQVAGVGVEGNLGGV